ncbi:hypothetical protein AB0J80_31805 [Actinoplanes sp. NPDC049548]|uniref:hypothetical protein n=1 Tax=Actinoplanes sp. NPDC049548 TaxID=3155152 RepID=UPI00341B928B
MSKSRMRMVAALAATAVAGGVFGAAAPAQAASGKWEYWSWYEYKSTCDEVGRQVVNRSSTDHDTAWRCDRDAPGYKLFVYHTS